MKVFLFLLQVVAASAIIFICSVAFSYYSWSIQYECGMRDVRTGVCTQYDLKEELK